MGLKEWLGLSLGQGDGYPVKQWPANLAEDCTGPIVTFGIPLKSAKTSRDWDVTQSMLGTTLRSVFRQSDPRWRVVICGHEVPELPELADPRVEYIAAGFKAPPPPQPNDAGRARADKWRKRRIIGARLQDVGAGFYMDLDSDDLVHCDLVANALRTEHGCVITTGYVCDVQTELIAPLPGVLSVDFDRICGSMAVVRYEHDDLPAARGRNRGGEEFLTASNHGYLRGTREEGGKPLEVVPFAAAIYVLNNQDNLSFVDNRLGNRGSHLVSRIHAHAITDKSLLNTICEDFGWPC